VRKGENGEVGEREETEKEKSNSIDQVATFIGTGRRFRREGSGSGRCGRGVRAERKKGER